jgi:hypothetical protein
MTDAITDTTNAIVPLIGLGIVAGMAGKMMNNNSPRTRTITKTKIVYRKAKVKGVSPVKHHKHHKTTRFLS